MQQKISQSCWFWAYLHRHLGRPIKSKCWCYNRYSNTHGHASVVVQHMFRLGCSKTVLGLYMPSKAFEPDSMHSCVFTHSKRVLDRPAEPCQVRSGAISCVSNHFGPVLSYTIYIEHGAFLYMYAIHALPAVPRLTAVSWFCLPSVKVSRLLISNSGAPSGAEALTAAASATKIEVCKCNNRGQCEQANCKAHCLISCYNQETERRTQSGTMASLTDTLSYDQGCWQVMREKKRRKRKVYTLRLHYKSLWS